MGKEVASNLLHHSLSRFDHELVVGQGRKRAAEIHDAHGCHRADQTLHIPGHDKAVDDRL